MVHVKTEIAPVIMLQGTASDVGKSILATALCRILVQEGKRTAPFKSQNMSLNSYVTPDGKEIGRAQGLQADACGIPATTDMNPILLKPKKDSVAQVVVHGKPLADYDARTYREEYLPQAEGIVKEALLRLRTSYDVVVIEGAGSPAEINLKDRDIVNMRLAGWADAPVLLVADIDRGGVFASIVGTMEILTSAERDRVAGFVINKFRGDVTLLKPGLEWLEERTGKPVLGVIPYHPELGLEDEDSASLDAKLGTPSPLKAGQLDIAVLRLPRMSNFTDFDPLQAEPDVRLRYITSVQGWGQPDAVIVPGSKNTVDDLLYLQRTGLAQRLRDYADKEQGRLLGICAGYQMMGSRLLDPDQVESDQLETEALGFFPAVTTYGRLKRTVRVEGRLDEALAAPMHDVIKVQGYEIHMGQTSFTEPVRPLFKLRDMDTGAAVPSLEHPDGVVAEDGRLIGTYLHDVLHNDEFRRAWLNRARAAKTWSPLHSTIKYRENREAALDRLANHVRTHLAMDVIHGLLHKQQRIEGS